MVLFIPSWAFLMIKFENIITIKVDFYEVQKYFPTVFSGTHNK